MRSPLYGAFWIGIYLLLTAGAGFALGMVVALWGTPRPKIWRRGQECTRQLQKRARAIRPARLRMAVFL